MRQVKPSPIRSGPPHACEPRRAPPCEGDALPAESTILHRVKAQRAAISGAKETVQTLERRVRNAAVESTTLAVRHKRFEPR
jgi:hypothetical protein